MSDKKLSDALSHMIGLILVLAIILVINVLAGGIRLRGDLTEENIYTLSKGTKTMVRELPRKAQLKLYFSRSNERVPIPVKQFGQRVYDLLREYVAASDGNVTLEVFDPKPDSDEEEWAARYGVTGQPVDRMGAAPSFYLGLAAVSGSKEAVIPAITPNAEPQLEYRITQLLHEVTQVSKPKLAVLTDLPVLGGPQPMPFQPAQQEPQRPWAVMQELKRQYDVVEMATDATDVPEDTRLLMLIDPRELSDRTLYAIDQYVMRGGRVMAFVDPLSIVEQQTAPQPAQFGRGAAASEVNTLTQAWGAELKVGHVVGDAALSTQVPVGRGQVAMLPTWLSLRGNRLHREDLSMSTLEFLELPLPGGWTIEEKDGVQVEVLAMASPDSRLVNTFVATQAGGDALRTGTAEKEIPLIVRLQGVFPSAFPEGAPADDTSEPSGQEVPIGSSVSHLASGEAEGVVLLVADVDMLFDQIALQQLGFFGQTIYQPKNDNLAFALNMVEQLTGNEALIGLRSRGKVDRPFDRVLALEKKAQERWREEESDLVGKLQAAQARLNELQRAKSDDQKLILSEDQKKEIATFRKQEFETRKELREVRKSLRREIDRLGFKVKAVNMAAVPLAVAVFGLAYGLRRRKYTA